MVSVTLRYLAFISVALAGLSHVTSAPPQRRTTPIPMFSHSGLKGSNQVQRRTTSVPMFGHSGLKASNSGAANSTAINHPALGKTARDLLARSTPAAPHFLVYSDRFVSGLTGPPDASLIQGFNVFAMSFLLTSGPADKAEEWVQLTATQRSAVKAQYAAAGIKLIVSAFGATDAPTSAGADPIATANTMASWVLQFGLDGIDVDYEDLNAMDFGGGSAEAWLTSFTQQLRVQLPQGQFILTHAPLAPWFSPGRFTGGAYLTVNNNVGNLIDWYNVQFYNQGTTEYTTCQGLLTQSSSTWPQTALFQIIASGVPSDKLVIGKPATSGDAASGFVDTGTLAGCLAQAKSGGWSAGAMAWEYPDANAAWISSVRSQAFP